MAEFLLDLPPKVSADEVRLLLASQLYERGRLSLSQAARLAGCSKATFTELLGKLGVVVFDYPPPTSPARWSCDGYHRWCQ